MSETIDQKAQKPLGLMPKQLQNYVILGVATVLIVIIWLTSGSDRKPAKQNTTPGNSQDLSRLNTAKLEDYKNQLAAQERLLREQQALLLGQQPPAKSEDLPDSSVLSAGPAATQNPREALATQLALEQQKKDYQSLFATNMALTYRQETKQSSEAENFKEFLKVMGKNQAGERTPQQGEENAQGFPVMPPRSNWPVYPNQKQVPVAPGIPSIPVQQSSTQPTSAAETEAAPDTIQKAGATKVADYNHSAGKHYRVLAGTVLETVLLNRINSDFSGPVNSMLTSPVYSHDRQRILIPEGSKVLGEAQKLATLGQQRVAVAFHRLIMPDGFSLSLDQFKGLNQIGETALRDKVNNHYLRIFGLSVALGLISGFSNRGVTYYGPGASGTDLYRTGVAESLSRSSERILDRYINILPTVTILEGHRVKVHLTNDLFMPDYMNHNMPSDLAVDQTSIPKEEGR